MVNVHKYTQFRWIFFIIIHITLVSCASQAPKVNSELGLHLDFFLKEYKKSMDIQFSDEEGFYYDVAKDHVRINQEHWQGLNSNYREAIMLHEFGHSILGRVHENKKFLTDGCSYSIMYYKIDGFCYRKHKNHYLKELFERKFEFKRGY